MLFLTRCLSFLYTNPANWPICRSIQSTCFASLSSVYSSGLSVNRTERTYISPLSYSAGQSDDKLWLTYFWSKSPSTLTPAGEACRAYYRGRCRLFPTPSTLTQKKEYTVAYYRGRWFCFQPPYRLTRTLVPVVLESKQTGATMPLPMLLSDWHSITWLTVLRTWTHIILVFFVSIRCLE